ncbi:MAG: 16S rRNA (cytidine(1402)-2'-O)-methyltransferase [Nitrospirae bacterium]|nr:16S rRNA (cytidine(1402)-2'-O)-methyltransferase [Nitrospirota bacterium]
MTDKPASGTLYIVSTPIGNLEDITLRALKVLGSVRIIAAEDTRHTQRLLHHYDIHTPQTSYHDHNKEEKSAILIAKLKEGLDIALVSDAGTPGISDPGYYLINRAIDDNIRITPVPGPTASIAALSISGLPTDAFVFEGFLPAKKAARQKRFREICSERRTIIMFDTPRRVSSSLEDIAEILGNRRVVLTRELTKMFEEVIRGRVINVMEKIRGRVLKGEITIIIEGAHEETAFDVADLTGCLKRMMQKEGLSLKDAVGKASKELNLPRSKVYSEALKIHRSPSITTRK